MNKVLLIGIDSLAPELLVKYENDLPNFTKLRQGSPKINSKSVFPVDSIPAWVSIYTGWNPARHGIVYTFDIFDSSFEDILNIDINIFKGKTFWDYAGGTGKKVCVLFPFLAYPPWEVNAVMVSRATMERSVEGEAEWVVDKETEAYPSRVMENYKIPRFMRGVSGKHPGKRDLKRWAEDAKKALIEESELSFKMCQNYDWDLFFVFFGWLDIIQHRLWRFSDEHDPTYPGMTPYKDIIKEFYQLLDKILGKYMELYPDATTIVFSDHGHGIRPAKTVNINEVLRKRGLLLSKSKRFNPLPYLKEGIKTKLLDFVSRFELDYWLVNLSTKTKTLSSLSKRVYMSSSSIDMVRTMAYLSSFAGVKSYSHGGIEIKRENLKGRDYEELRDQIINELAELKEPHSGEKLVDWICRREDLYPGPRVSQAYPDIVFELKEGYGTHWSIHAPLIGTAYDHKLASGGHKKNAVFLITNSDRKPIKEDMTLMDIAPTVLDLLGVKVEEEIEMDGTSIFKEEER